MNMSNSFDFVANEMPDSTLSEFEIAPGRKVGGKNPCFIIAEIGQNHQGDIQLAKQLIDIASNCGVDCVKFQKSSILHRFTNEVLNRPYVSENSWGKTYGEHRLHLELTDENFYELKKYSNDLGIYFAASGMDKPSIDFLGRLEVPFFKIGSADTTNLPLLRHTCKYQKPLLISTGMTDIKDVCIMYKKVSELNESIALLQCTSCYPTLPCHTNINVIKTYKELFPKAVIGYSGHELGLGISLAAVAYGAKILERHITLSHCFKGSDHIVSLEPDELKQLVVEIRKIEEAMKPCEKQVQDCEIPCYEKLGKTIVTTRRIKKGTSLDENMLDIKVAIKKGYHPIQFDELLGREVKRNIEAEESILPCDLV